jgi:uracil-DNA glycosylase
VDHPVVEEWTWRRITESWAECIIALGSIAEHGLLRLFIRHEAKISCNVPPLTQQRQEQNLPPCWVDRPADPGRPLRYWLELGRWWTISIPGRDIRLLPAFHPARIDDYDPGYERTGKALAACLGVDGI